MLPLVVFLAVSGAFCSCSVPEVESLPVKLNVSSAARESGSSYFWIGVEADCKWELSLDFGAADPWAVLRQSSGDGNATVGCDYSQNPTMETRSLTIRLKGANGTEAVCSVRQNALAPPPAQPCWIELPAPREDLYFSSHSFSYESGGRSVTMRNYSYGYLPEKRVAIWVAYPLNDFYISGSSRRDDFWMVDAGLPEAVRGEQPSLDLGSYSGNYDRGHQCPAADRKCNQTAMNQTFYCTNATPQLSAFNQGFWADIEGRVRAYSSKCDTLYVVTGCIMDGTKKTTDRAGKTCPVPGHYYKALLARGGRAGTWTAVGFLFDPDRDAAASRVESYMVRTIDELEEATGLDFFPNLISVAGEDVSASIEAADPYSNQFWELGSRN